MTRMREHGADDRKMKELILYLAARSEDDPRFSSTKLNKLLFYCDFTAYRQLGRSITGHPGSASGVPETSHRKVEV